MLKMNLTKIKAEMERVGINQGDLARAMGMSRQAISQKLLSERATLKTVEQFAKALNLPEKDLLI